MASLELLQADVEPLRASKVEVDAEFPFKGLASSPSSSSTAPLPSSASAAAAAAAAGLPSAPAALRRGRAGRPVLQIAPMMEITYKDFRQFMRLLTKETQLWTEMWVDNTLIHSERVDGFLEYGPNEHPIVCQLGGSSPDTLGRAAKIVGSWGYDEINLNCGCPSDRVAGHGEFGASLMLKPELVRDCMKSLLESAAVPATVKCRLGVDDHDSPEFAAAFVRTVAEAGVRHFIIHARKCLLCGLTPDQNRRIPPLMYDRVYRLCTEFPELEFSLNGGVNSLEEVERILAEAPDNLVGVMIGRAAYNNPCLLADADRRLYGAAANPATASSRHALLTAYCEYLEKEHPASGFCAGAGSGATQGALKPMLGVFHGLPGNKLLRQTVNKLSHDKGIRAAGPAAVLRLVIEALDADPQAHAHLHAPLVSMEPDGSGGEELAAGTAPGPSAPACAAELPSPLAAGGRAALAPQGDLEPPAAAVVAH